MPSQESKIGALIEGQKNTNQRIEDIKDENVIRDKNSREDNTKLYKMIKHVEGRTKRLEDWRTWLLGIASALGIVFGLFAKKIMKTLGF